MASQLIENHRDGAEIYHGEALCKQKLQEIFGELCLPKGLLPIDMTEFGLNRSSGFLWCKQEKKSQHKFERINKNVSYETEIAANFEKARLKNLIGVKSKEFFAWITISGMFIEDPSTGKITMQASNGLTAGYPTSAFEPEDKDVGQKN